LSHIIVLILLTLNQRNYGNINLYLNISVLEYINKQNINK